EHQVELPRFGELTLPEFTRVLRRFAQALRILELVGAKAALARLAIDEGIDEPSDVATRFPDARVHENRRLDPLDVVARAHHRLPPALLQVALQLNPERPVIPH